jgi:signal transduction histidine kinase
MESIVEDTLTLARQGDTVGETEQCVVSDVVGQCWGMVETHDANLEIADRFWLQADRDRLRHVFENLFRNAVEHGSTSSHSSSTREDAIEHGTPSTTVRVGRLPDGFYVEDDGPGIPPERRESVFEPGETTTRDGTGFGLSIVKRVVEAHGWQIAITEGTDGGARFEITGVDVSG